MNLRKHSQKHPVKPVKKSPKSEISQKVVTLDAEPDIDVVASNHKKQEIDKSVSLIIDDNSSKLGIS